MKQKLTTKISPLILLAKYEPSKDPIIIPGNHFLITFYQHFLTLNEI